MNYKIIFNLVFITYIFSLTSCSQKEPAIVDYHGKKTFKRDQASVKSGDRVRSNSASEKYIIIEPGDTLKAIAKEHNVNYDDLVNVNNIENDDLIKVGEKLVLPSKTSRKSENIISSSEITHEEDEAKVESRSLRRNDIEKSKLQERLDEELSSQTIIEDDEDDTKLEEKSNDDQIELKIPVKEKETIIENDVPTSTEIDDSSNQQAIKINSKYTWPLKGKIISKFGNLPNGIKNDGINIAAPESTPIRAADDGVVVYSGNGLKGYGNLIIIKNNDILMAYAHQKSLLVQKNTKITAGQVIGYVGATGNVTSPQLYFAIKQGKKAINPENFLK